VGERGAGIGLTCRVCGKEIFTPALTPVPGFAIIDLDAGWTALAKHYEDEHPEADMPERLP
jgi:hypothetical protein